MSGSAISLRDDNVLSRPVALPPGEAAGVAAPLFAARARAPRIAIVHEWLEVYAGSERVLEQLLLCFPDADLLPSSIS